jgi:hypothetical protein
MVMVSADAVVGDANLGCSINWPLSGSVDELGAGAHHVLAAGLSETKARPEFAM